MTSANAHGRHRSDHGGLLEELGLKRALDAKGLRVYVVTLRWFPRGVPLTFNRTSQALPPWSGGWSDLSLDLQLTDPQSADLQLGNPQLTDDRFPDRKTTHRQGADSGSSERSGRHRQGTQAKGSNLTALHRDSQPKRLTMPTITSPFYRGSWRAQRFLMRPTPNAMSAAAMRRAPLSVTVVPGDLCPSLPTPMCRKKPPDWARTPESRRPPASH